MMIIGSGEYCAAVAEARAVQTVPYVVAPGQEVTTHLRGVLGEGAEIKPEFFDQHSFPGGPLAVLERLVQQGFVIKPASAG